MTLRLSCALVLAISLGASAYGCSDAHTTDMDSGILLPDTGGVDTGGPRPDAFRMPDAAMVMCGFLLLGGGDCC
jgi:hypothetical protein